MSQDKKTNPTKIMSFVGYLMFFGLGLLFFFFSAFIVILVRTKSDTKIIMPDLVGQNYVDVHNELMRLRLKVKIETKRYVDKNDGEILYQSISPGKKLESGSKLYLTINNGTDRILVPELRGQQLNNAREMLNKVLSGENYVSIELGGITYVPLTEGLTPDTVIDQIPEPGKSTTTREKIFLLVTETGNKNDKSSSLSPELRGKPFPFVATSLHRYHRPFRIKEIIQTKDRRENGLITGVEGEESQLLLSVSLFPFEEKNFQGYETLRFTPSAGKYSAVQKPGGDNPSSKEIFHDMEMQPGTEFQYVFYRVGDVEVDILRGTEKVQSFKFKADYQK